MKKLITSLPLVLLLCVLSCNKKSTYSLNPDKGSAFETTLVENTNGYSYEVVKNDPTGLRLYTLDNGLKVYLSKNTDEPKIQTFIAVKAGSSYDPKNSTGLAHYLEHMVFKGTDKIGTINWEKEKVLLDKISNLYEQHRAETDPEKKKAIYRQIDETSLEASNYCVANEYDKMVSSLGATDTNAFTSYEQTVYQNKIPANELDKWLAVESERFSKLVLRLFHTELEAVFEEFNMSQDNDGRKMNFATMDALFPKHPYGQQTTIGVAEHLKNPSMVDIHNYFNKYYVPNNMAVVLVGDIDFDQTIQKVDKAFGKMKKQDLVHPKLPKEEPITNIISTEVFGPTAERVSINYRTPKVGSKEEKLLTLISIILSNNEAGLIDLNLNQKQLVQGAYCYEYFLKDYGLMSLGGSPKEGQTLDEVKDLLLSQIDIIKKGEFEDWMIAAVINDMKLSQISGYDNNTNLAYTYLDASTSELEWKDKVTFIDELQKITKQELVDYANEFFKDNYVVTYKRKGQDKNVAKVENPGITPVNLNRGKQSKFVENFSKLESVPLQPLFIDYKKEIKKTLLNNGIEVSYIENKKNDLFNLNIIFDMGRDNNKMLSLAVQYLDYLGTDKYTPEQLKKEFYKLGISYYVSAANDKSYVGLRGLKENLPEGLKLLEHLWMNAIPNQEAYDKLVKKIAKDRLNNKTQKVNILRDGLYSYGQYGENSRLRNIYQLDELEQINPEELVNLIKDVRNFKQRIFYYGKDIDAAVASLNKEHEVPSTLKDYPETTTYKELETGGNVYFVDYDMVQSEMIFLAKGAPFNADNMAASRLFNTYFGRGLSSIVFQEIRESKSLAYSAFSSYSNASQKDKSNYVMAYVGTQANKMEQAISAMMDLMNNMPEAEKQFNAAKEATLKKIAAQRITKSDIFWSYERLQKLGIDNDNREAIYKAVKNMSMQDLKTFFDKNVKGNQYNLLVIGNKKDMDMTALAKFGKIKELVVDYLFNYSK